MHLQPRSPDHPDAARLIEQVQLEYVERYGARDETPVDPAEFAEGNGVFLVGYAGGEAVASGAWRWHRPVPGVALSRVAEVKRMYVTSTHRRRGLARAVLGRLEELAGDAGAAAVILETGSAQPEAIGLYEACGYTPIAPFGHYRDAPGCRCFAKRLGGPTG